MNKELQKKTLEKISKIDHYSAEFARDFVSCQELFYRLRTETGSRLNHDAFDTPAYFKNYLQFNLQVTGLEAHKITSNLNEYDVIEIGGQRGALVPFLPEIKTYTSIDSNNYSFQLEFFPWLKDLSFINANIFSFIEKHPEFFKKDKLLIICSNVLNEFFDFQIDNLFQKLSSINPNFEFLIIENQRKKFKIENSFWGARAKDWADREFRINDIPTFEIEGHHLQKTFRYSVFSSIELIDTFFIPSEVVENDYDDLI